MVSKLLLLSIALISLHASRVLYVSAVSPFRKQKRWRENRIHSLSFSWSASLNETTGIASSQESSSFVASAISSNNKKNHELTELAENLFSSYLSWLVRPMNTFGVLREKVASMPTQQADTGDTAVQLRIGNGVSLLCFGRPRSVKTLKHNIVESVSTIFPITGGLFALHSARGPTIHVPSMKQTDNGMGELCLTLHCVNRDVGRKKSTPCHLQMETKLVGYRPWLAGRAPIHPVRKWFYLSTQSIVHAYVMWRFHRHVSHQIICQ